MGQKRTITTIGDTTFMNGIIIEGVGTCLKRAKVEEYYVNEYNTLQHHNVGEVDLHAIKSKDSKEEREKELWRQLKSLGCTDKNIYISISIAKIIF